jgi:hypothetical protein
VSRAKARLSIGLVAALAACSGEPGAKTTTPEAGKISGASIGGIAELEALLKQHLGRGALVNVWATW